MSSWSELAGLFRHFRRRLQPHQPLLESFGGERSRERLLYDEDDAVPALTEDVGDPDTVIGRSEGALGEKDDRSRRR